MSNGNTFNFGNINQTASGQGSVNQVGNNTATTTVNNGEAPPTVPEVFDALRKSMFSTEVQEGMTPLDDQSAVELEESVVRPLQTMAELSPEEINKPDTMEQAQSLINRLVPYAPQISKGLATFGSAALEALASRNPMVAGVLAVCRLASA